MIKARAKKLKEDDKKMIIKSYEMGIKPAVIAAQLDRTSSCIKTFHSRHSFNHILPPKEKKSKGKIQGRMCLVIKVAAQEFCKLSLNKLAQKVKELMPGQPWYPKKTCLAMFLKSNNFVKRRPALKPPLSEANRVVS